MEVIRQFDLILQEKAEPVIMIRNGEGKWVADTSAQLVFVQIDGIENIERRRSPTDVEISRIPIVISAQQQSMVQSKGAEFSGQIHRVEVNLPIIWNKCRCERQVAITRQGIARRGKFIGTL